jgi:hypothetical protein
MMKKLSIAAFAVSALMLTACDNGSNIVECESDDDCSGDTPTCDIPDGDTVGQCVAGDDEECAEDLDCQLANGDSATSADDCSANTDCDGGDRCVEDQLGATYCVTIAADQAECDLISLTYVSLTDIDGGAGGGCVADGACTEDGQCE